jgi:NAD(P)-dependent dehydrogenase (short-subunit alcohol dehydrogenase family)
MKNVIITGSSSGFGLKAAKDFADKGYKVFATMRNPMGKNARVKAELEGHSAHITVVDMDVTNDASVQQAIGGIIAAEGKVDVLINNAGIMFIGITEAFSVDQAHEQMNANYYGAIRTMQTVLPAMRKAGTGLIINTSSLVGRISPPFFGTYTATKHALEGYSQALRYEVATFGVDVAIVEPGPFGTNLLASGKPPALGDVLASYGELAGVPTAMGAQFAQMLQNEGAPNPQWVVDAYLSLAEMPAGQRPIRTVVGISWGVNEMNRLTQPIQDKILQEMQLDDVLGGVSA